MKLTILIGPPGSLNGFMFPFFLGKGLDDMIKKEIRPKANVL